MKKILIAIITIALSGALIFFAFQYYKNKFNADNDNNKQNQTNLEQRIIKEVKQLPEVREFAALIQNAGNSRFAVDIATRPDNESPDYLIQVYEIFHDHTATFGWYRYNTQDGKIEQEL